VIHDVAYDFYGKRLATCSSDRKIKIWKRKKGEWKLTAEWVAHKGSIWKLDWAHPKYGQIIASCSFDRTVCLWEEVDEDDKEESTSKKVWQRRATLVDSRDSVTDIKFAPHFASLKLATCSVDGFVRIYEPNDVINLSHWTLTEEFESHKAGSNCRLSWNSYPLNALQMVVAADTETKVWSRDENSGKWRVLYFLSGHTREVTDVTWSPNVGRTFHLIATASKDGTIRIWNFPSASNNEEVNVNERNEFMSCTVLKAHNAPVWRVQWNLTGSVLASSGDDSHVFLWKSNSKGDQWKQVCVMDGHDDHFIDFEKIQV